MSSNLARKAARREQQTCLTFDPIDPDLRSSSPATHMSAAKVRFQRPNQRTTPSSSRATYMCDNGASSEDVLSSSQKSNMVKGKSEAKVKASGGKLLPTPAKSSQIMPKGKGSFDTSEDNEVDDNMMILPEHRPSIRARASATKMGTSSSRRQGRPLVDLDEADGSLPEDEDEIETPSKNKSKNKKGKQKAFDLSPRDLDEDGGERDDPPVLPDRSSKSKRAASATKSASKTKARGRKSVTLSGGSDDELSVPIPKDSRNGKVSKLAKKEPLALELDDLDDLPILSPSRKQRKSIIPDDDESDADLPLTRKLTRYFLSPKNHKSNGQAIEAEDESDEDVILTSPTRHRPRVSVQEDEESDEEPISSFLKNRKRPAAVDTDDSDIPSLPRKRRLQVNDEATAADDDSDDSELPSIRKTQSKGKSRSGRASSSNTPARITRQSKGRKHRTAKEKQIQLLKRKRAGENIDELTDSTEESDEERRGLYDTDSDLAMLSNFEDESEHGVVQKPKKKNRTSNVDSYHLPEDSDFIVEDDDAPIGVPYHSLHEIPLQFRHAAHKPLKEHFKDAIEWMVHRKINPAFSRDDEVYTQAFTKLDDEYQGYAKSKFVSTQWTVEFTKALFARPIFIERPCAEGEGFTLDGVPKCDVCNHRKHYPKFAIHFEGKPYYKTTLEEVEKDSDEDADDDDEVSVNSKGHVLPPEDKEWFSGNICRDNAQQAHNLIHWKFALNEWVIDQLTTEGYLSPSRLAEREKMKAKQRRNYANNLVDGWERDGVVKGFYGDFKRQIEVAREMGVGGGRWERGGGD